MSFSNKIVTTVPLQFIWTDQGKLQAVRASYLTSEDIKRLLGVSTVQFVIADIGQKLEWIDKNLYFDFWKKEIKEHIADNIDKTNLDDFKNHYAYVASVWTHQNDTPIILLEKFH